MWGGYRTYVCSTALIEISQQTAKPSSPLVASIPLNTKKRQISKVGIMVAKRL